MPAADSSPDSNSPVPDNEPLYGSYDDQRMNQGSPASVLTADRLEFERLPRRPGLGMIHEIYEGPRDPKGPPTAEEAKTLLKYESSTKLEAPLKAGETVLLLSVPFYERLIQWLDSGNDDLRQRIGLVDNTVLFEYYESFERPGRMRTGLKMGVDFVCVSTETWGFLMDWFGGGPGTARKVVNDNGRVQIDVRGVEIKVKRSSNPRRFMRHTISKYDTVGTLKRMAVDAWKKTLQNGYTETNYRIWDYYNDKREAQMYPDSAQLESFRIFEGQTVMFEEPDLETGEFLWEPDKGDDGLRGSSVTDPLYYNSGSSVGYSDYRSRRPGNTFVSNRRSVVPGAVGLSNLGNTCFMNSTLQCLSNIWPLRDRFVRDEYRADINSSNVLGTGGKLANTFGDLMKLLWSNGGDIVSPTGFKSVIAEFKPQFSGYQQHDSQELLSVLLDGLHEDLNRVKVKPVTEPVEAKGRPDVEVAAEACHVHRLRNSSFVNDLFEGFYKSTVVCPDCNRVSVTFDPFTMVQLPVSRARQVKTVNYSVSVLDEESGLPCRNKPTIVHIPEDGYIREARIKACELNGRNPDDFIVASLYQERIDKLYGEFDRPEKYSVPDKVYAFGDANARRLRMLYELHANGCWYRPIFRNLEMDDSDDFMNDFECIDPSSSSTSSAPSSPESIDSAHASFREGEVWIGVLEQHRFRIRMQVSRVSEVGPWEKGLGHYVVCILDVSPNAYSHYDRSEGVEEAAYEMVGLIPLYPSKGPANSVTFEQTRFKGAFGSYYGDYAKLTSDWPPLVLTGVHDPHGFFHGTVEEKQSNARRGMYYTVSYSYSKPFSMIRVDDGLRLELEPALSWLDTEPTYGPRPMPPPELLMIVTLSHRRSGRVVGQPSIFTVSGTATPADLYKRVLERMTNRGKARLSSMDDGEADPFGLSGTFRLTLRIPGVTYPIELAADDSTTVLASLVDADEVPKLIIEAEWDPVLALEEESRAGVALFGPLYPDGNPLDDDHAGTKLYDCFDMFSEQEKLTATETWYCSNCKDHKEAFKRMELWELPPVLIIHLKRFSQTMSSYLFDKDDTEVDFPLENLDLSDRVQSPLAVRPDDCVYDLVAVSHHYGGLGGGHYIAHARNETDGLWYEFDDSAVRHLGTSAQAARKVKGSSAYVLMYMRRTLTREKWGPAAEPSLPTDADSSTPDNDDFGVV